MVTTSSTRLAETAETALAQDAIALQTAVSDLVRIYQFRDRDRICCHDVSVTQCYALETLVRQGPMRLSALAERLFLDKSTTSRVVRTLIRKGYVVQRIDRNDGRATTLHTTRKGQRLSARISDDLVQQQKQLLQDFDQEVRSGVVQVIRRLANAAHARFRSGLISDAGACCTPVDSAHDCG